MKMAVTRRNVMKTEVINEVWPNEQNTLPYKVIFHLQCTWRNQTKMAATNNCHRLPPRHHNH